MMKMNLRRGPARRGRDPLERRAGHDPQSAGGAARSGSAWCSSTFSLFDTLTAAENVWLGLDKSLQLAEVTRRITKVAGEYGLDVDALRPGAHAVGRRAPAGRDRARADDEPEAADPRRADLGADAAGVQTLFVTLRKLASEGCSILYISHKLDEIRALCPQLHRAARGRVTGEVDPTKESNASLSRLMIRAEPPQLQHREARPVRRARGRRPDPREGRPVRHEPRRHRLRGARRRDRRHRRRHGQRPAGADGGAVRRGHARAGRIDTPLRQGHRAPAAATATRAGLHFVPEERLGRGRRADALARREHAADAHRQASAAAAGSAPAT